MTARKIHADMTSEGLRRWARREIRGQTVAQAYTTANAFDGLSRAGQRGG